MYPLHLQGVLGLGRLVGRRGGGDRGQGLGVHEGLAGRHPQLLQRVREEADAPPAAQPVVAQLRPVPATARDHVGGCSYLASCQSALLVSSHTDTVHGTSSMISTLAARS